MKRLLIITATIVLMIQAGCTNGDGSPYLRMDSNIDAISETAGRSIAYGEPIIREGKGVMVIFRDKGQIPFKVPDDTFYLYYAGDGQTVKNGDGTEFNYVLRCPAALLGVYKHLYR